MYPTAKVFAQLAAINTLIENFPMSILDMFQGKRYTSVFNFIIDLLNACGVNTNEIIDFLLKTLYGFEGVIEGGLQGLYDGVKCGTIELDDQSPFIEIIDNGIKVVLMALFTTIFGCSAIPYIYDGYMDLDPFVNPDKKIEIDSLVFPTSVLDIIGMMGINPTTEEGLLYYSIGGYMTYYRKTLVPVINTNTNNNSKRFKIAIQIVYEHENNNDESIWKFFLLDEDGKKIVDSKNAATEDIKIYVNYNKYENQTSNTWIGVIEKGQTATTEELFICPKDTQQPPKASKINYISINNQGTSAKTGGDSFVYLDKETSFNATNACYEGIGEVLMTPYNKEKTEYWSKDSKRHQIIKEWDSLWENTNNWGHLDGIETDYSNNSEEYRYIVCKKEEVYYKKKENPNLVVKTVLRVPLGAVGEEDSEYIAYCEGLRPNELYKAMDMNAFIWYVINKGMNEPQIEKNHLMWDSRVSAAKSGIKRNSAKEWNEWYDSKSDVNKTQTCEFLYSKPSQKEESVGSTINYRITNKSSLYPILQFDRLSWDKSKIVVRMPSQRYYKPRYREDLIKIEQNTGGKGVLKWLTLNSSLYKFDWDYLKNIQILHPKIMIIRMCEYLLGLSLTAAGSLNINTTRKLIEGKVMTATKKIIEADDDEVEDCYMVFSNEEYDELINELLFSKYTATRYNGEVNKAMVHDTEKYVAMINDINNNSATISGTTAQIKRLVNEITTNGANEEPTLEYGIDVPTNENLLQKLVWAIVMPIVESILTPQIILLIMINFQITGIVNFNNEPFGHDYGKIMNLVLNKILGLTKSIIKLIKDEIIILLLKLFFEKILPLLIKWKMAIYLEYLASWLLILQAALACLPTYVFPRNRIISSIDYVDYADIDSSQNIPESTSTC